MLICVTKAEIDDFDVIVIIHQQIFRLKVSMADSKLV